jgi:hypothetical protein
MLTQSRAVLLLLGLLAVVLLVVLIRSRSGPPGRTGRELEWELVPGVTTEAEWARRIEATDRRIAAKEAAVQELIAGRRELEEVAAFFAQVDGNDPTLLRWLRTHYRGQSDQERRWRQVLGCARAILEHEGDPDKERLVLARLEAELQRLLRGEEGLQPAPQEENRSPA